MISSDFFITHWTAENLEGGDNEYVSWAGEIQIKKKNNEILERLIKPFDKNNVINNKKTWSIGANYFDREIDPFVESLINKYNVFDKNIKEILKSNV